MKNSRPRIKIQDRARRIAGLAVSAGSTFRLLPGRPCHIFAPSEASGKGLGTYDSTDAGTDARPSSSSSRSPRADIQTSCPGPSDSFAAFSKTPSLRCPRRRRHCPRRSRRDLVGVLWLRRGPGRRGWMARHRSKCPSSGGTVSCQSRTRALHAWTVFAPSSRQQPW